MLDKIYFCSIGISGCVYNCSDEHFSTDEFGLARLNRSKGIWRHCIKTCYHNSAIWKYITLSWRPCATMPIHCYAGWDYKSHHMGKDKSAWSYFSNHKFYWYVQFKEFMLFL